MRKDAGQDPLAHVGIQPHAGQVLEPQVAVGVDLGAPRPLLQQGRLPGVGGEQVDPLLATTTPSVPVLTSPNPTSRSDCFTS